jgi:hypothetical protein
VIDSTRFIGTGMLETKGKPALDQSISTRVKKKSKSGTSEELRILVTRKAGPANGEPDMFLFVGVLK